MTGKNSLHSDIPIGSEPIYITNKRYAIYRITSERFATDLYFIEDLLHEIPTQGPFQSLSTLSAMVLKQIESHPYPFYK